MLVTDGVVVCPDQTSTIPASLAAAADFSRSSIEARIETGYHDAIKQGIGIIDAPESPRRVRRLDAYRNYATSLMLKAP